MEDVMARGFMCGMKESEKHALGEKGRGRAARFFTVDLGSKVCGMEGCEEGGR